MQHSLDNFPLKRSHSQQATARVQQQPIPPPLNPADFPPGKLQRGEADTSAAFSSARHRSLPSSSSVFPSTTMASRGRGFPKRQGGHSSFNVVDRPSHRHQAKPSSSSKRGSRSSPFPKNIFNGPMHDQDFISKEYSKSGKGLKEHWKQTPKSPLHNFYAVVKNGQQPRYESTRGSIIQGDKHIEIWRYVCSSPYHLSNCNRSIRTTVFLEIDPPIFGVGDHTDKKESMNLAALSAVYQLHELNLVCYLIASLLL